MADGIGGCRLLLTLQAAGSCLPCQWRAGGWDVLLRPVPKRMHGATLAGRRLRPGCTTMVLQLQVHALSHATAVPPSGPLMPCLGEEGKGGAHIQQVALRILAQVCGRGAAAGGECRRRQV